MSNTVRTLTFEQISDSRFNGTKENLDKKCKDLLSLFSKFPDIKIKVDNPRKLEFDNDNSVSWRQRFYIQKVGRKTTWNEVMKKVNTVKAVPYNFVALNTF